MVQGNPRWGCIQGALANLKHSVRRWTIANVLKRNGIEPAPERSKRTRWMTFLRAHWKVLAASEYLTVEVWTDRGLVTHYLLFVISLVDRGVKIAGITTRPRRSNFAPLELHDLVIQTQMTTLAIGDDEPLLCSFLRHCPLSLRLK